MILFWSYNFPLLIYWNTNQFLHTGFIFCKLAKFIHYFQWLFGDSFEFSTWAIMVSSNIEAFISSFAMYMPFISCVCITALAKTSSSTCNGSGEDRYPCLVPSLREKAFFIIKYDVSYRPLCRCLLSTLSLIWEFLSWDVDYQKVDFFSFRLLVWWISLIDFWI